MEGYCVTGQSSQWAAVSMQEEEEKEGVVILKFTGVPLPVYFTLVCDSPNVFLSCTEVNCTVATDE
jgi:hypothetical protein